MPQRFAAGDRKRDSQLEELRHLEARAERLDLAERVMSLRPRDQITLARTHGAEVIERAAKYAPELAVSPVMGREEWMRNLAPSLDRALDRHLARRGLPGPAPGRTASWLETALERGLHPHHALQALARIGVPLTDRCAGPADRGIPLPEVLNATGHARASVRVVLGYYDAEASRQGQIAGWVAGALSPVLRAGATARGFAALEPRLASLRYEVQGATR